jgi:hypothetical protein
MRLLPKIHSLLPIVLAAFHAPSASAETEHTAESTIPLELHLDAQVGAYGGRAGEGLSVGALLLARGSVFEVGLEGQTGSGLLNYEYSALGGVAGLAFTPAKNWRVDLLGELGVDSYDHFDEGALLSGDPGASADLHYAGGRFALMHRVGSFEIGYAASFTRDLDDVNVRYTYKSISWVSSSDGENARTVRVGTYRLSGVLTLGVAFDL